MTMIKQGIKLKRRIFDMIQIGNREDFISHLFDYFIVAVIVGNLSIVIFDTFDASLPYKNILNKIEWSTLIFFAVEYVLRIWTADYLYPDSSEIGSRLRFIFSFYGIVDLLTFLPYFLPFLFPSGVVAFRILRVVRIFHLFKINQQYDAFTVITDVLYEKRGQLFFSICLILIMMLASSLCMYSLEHDAQPEIFENAFSGMWWSVSTLLTVGYGDIYPITVIGKIMAIFIAFLGVGLVAIPTGIISAGFVEQYTRVSSLSDIAEENNIRFIELRISSKSIWRSQYVRDIRLPAGLIFASILRDEELIIPRGDTRILEGDKLILGAEEYKDDIDIKLKEIHIKEKNKWVGREIRDLDISRQTLIVMIRRGRQSLIPKGTTVIRANDVLIVCEKKA